MTSSLLMISSWVMSLVYLKSQSHRFSRMLYFRDFIVFVFYLLVCEPLWGNFQEGCKVRVEIHVSARGGGSRTCVYWRDYVHSIVAHSLLCQGSAESTRGSIYGPCIPVHPSSCQTVHQHRTGSLHRESSGRAASVLWLCSSPSMSC